MKKILLTIGGVLVVSGAVAIAQSKSFALPTENIAYFGTGYVYPTIKPIMIDSIDKTYNFGEGGEISLDDIVINKQELHPMSVKEENFTKYNELIGEGCDPDDGLCTWGHCNPDDEECEPKPTKVLSGFGYNGGTLMVHKDTKPGTYEFDLTVCSEGNFNVDKGVFPQFQREKPQVVPPVEDPVPPVEDPAPHQPTIEDE